MYSSMDYESTNAIADVWTLFGLLCIYVCAYLIVDLYYFSKNVVVLLYSYVFVLLYDYGFVLTICIILAMAQILGVNK